MSLGDLVHDPAVRPQPLTRAQWDLLVNAGEFEGQHVELLEGVIAEMAPQGPEHGFAVARLTEALVVGLRQHHGRGFAVRPQTPYAAGRTSEPEPDVAVIDQAEHRPDRHPEHARLVVEVSATSQRTDLVHKARIYSRAHVDEYWVVDLAERRTVVHRNPDPDLGGFGTVVVHTWDEELPVLGIAVRLSQVLDSAEGSPAEG